MNVRKSVPAPEERPIERKISGSSDEMARFLTQQPKVKATNK